MDDTTYVSEPASELERLITDLSGSGPLVFVFGDGFTAAHLKGVTAPLFQGPADRRWWHVELGDETASWTMDARPTRSARISLGRRSWEWISWGQAGTRSFTAACTTSMRASGCARRSWRPGGHCANAMATATSRKPIKAPSWPRLPEPL